MTNVAGRTDDLEDQALWLLGSDKRHLLLATLLSEFGLEGRANYEGDDTAVEVAGRQLRCINELQIVVAKQLESDFAPGPPAYPDEAILAVLREKADRCLDWLRVLRRTLAHVERLHDA